MAESQSETGITPAALCFGKAAGDAVYAAYHDQEWGRPVTDEVALFEKICLEGFQVGLSWSVVLHKRAGFRKAFAGFDPDLVAAFGPADVERLLADAGIVRNRAKIEACIGSARAVLALHASGGSLSDVVWGFRPVAHARPETSAHPASTPESAALAKQLRKLGFRFVGPVNMYATMQACGLVNDHVVGCPVGDGLR
jgi:DNA-3-methyladenine glycosylase I